MKRFLDLIFSVFILIIVFPALIVITLVVVVDSGFPIFFVQKRMGYNGIPFNIYKFRTMSPSVGASNGRFDAGDSSRVTGVGRVLRKTKLDEIPQLFNVLKGDMSFVGPRPEVPQWVAAYPVRWEKVHRVRPGITDNASILYREEESILAVSENPEDYYRTIILPHKLDIYEQYVDNNSLTGDLVILLKTFWSVLLVKKS